MHILTTDILTCPRCGPEFGLVVLADRLEDRIVSAGTLGCPNCRESYPIEAGETDLSAGFKAPAAAPFERDPEWPFRMAALLGLAEERGTVLVVGPGSRATDEISAYLPEVMLIGVSRQPGIASGHTRVIYGQRLPFRDASIAGVVLAGDPSPDLLSEALRVLSRGRRLIVDPTPPEALDWLEDSPFEILLSQDGVTVASR